MSSSSPATRPTRPAEHLDGFISSPSSSSCSLSVSSSCSSPDTQPKDYVLLNSKSRRKKRAFIPDDKKDPVYWSQRSKNNLSAQRSRVKRRMNDLVLETKLTELNNENQLLRAKIDMLSRKFGHLTNKDDDSEKNSEQTPMLTLPVPTKQTAIAEEQSLLEKTTAVPAPMPIKWRFKLFNMTSTP